MRRSLAVVVAATSVAVILCGSARADTGSVHISGGAPQPSSITVNSGDTVVIFNDDDVEHAIFALGQQQGAAIAPHAGEEFGPFNTGGTAGRFDYRVDRDGPAGVIFVRATTATTATTRPTTTTRLTTTSTTIAKTTTTATTIAPTTTTAATTTTTAASSATAGTDGTIVVGQDTSKKKSKGIAAVGFLLLLAGLGGFVLLAVTARRRRGRVD